MQIGVELRFEVNPFKRQPHKMVKHTQIIRRQQPTNCFSDYFVGLELKGLKRFFYYLLHLSIANVVVEILRDRVPIDSRNGHDWKALYWAAASNQEGDVDELLEKGSDVNMQNRGCWTPLYMAAYNNNDVMETLLHHSANRSIVNNKDATTLDTAPI